MALRAHTSYSGEKIESFKNRNTIGWLTRE